MSANDSQRQCRMTVSPVARARRRVSWKWPRLTQLTCTVNGGTAWSAESGPPELGSGHLAPRGFSAKGLGTHNKGWWCRGVWARVTIDRCRHLALQTGKGHKVSTNIRQLCGGGRSPPRSTFVWGLFFLMLLIQRERDANCEGRLSRDNLLF